MQPVKLDILGTNPIGMLTKLPKKIIKMSIHCLIWRSKRCKTMSPPVSFGCWGELLQRGKRVFFSTTTRSICWMFMGPNPRPRKHLFFTKLINRNLIFLWISPVPPDLWKPWTDLMSLGRLGHVEKWWDFTQMLEMGCMMLHVTRNQFKEWTRMWRPLRLTQNISWPWSMKHLQYLACYVSQKHVLFVLLLWMPHSTEEKETFDDLSLSLSTKSWHFLNKTLH